MSATKLFSVGTHVIIANYEKLCNIDLCFSFASSDFPHFFSLISAVNSEWVQCSEKVHQPALYFEENKLAVWASAADLVQEAIEATRRSVSTYLDRVRVDLTRQITGAFLRHFVMFDFLFCSCSYHLLVLWSLNKWDLNPTGAQMWALGISKCLWVMN